MALIGCALLKNEPSALAINVADETMQADLGEHMATLVKPTCYYAVAFYLMACVVNHDELAMGTANRELKLAYTREKRIAQEEPASELG